MKRAEIINILMLIVLIGCDSGIISNQSQSSGGIFSPQKGISFMSTTPNDPLYSQQDYLNVTNVPEAWLTTHGSNNKKIAIIAMGGVYENHEDLQSRVTIKTSSFANFSAATPLAGIIGAATNNGKGIAGVNWVSPVLSYNISKITTETVEELPGYVPITKTFVDLNESTVAPAINGAVNAGAKTILLPLNWMLKDPAFEIEISKLQFYPCCRISNPVKIIYTVGSSIFNYISSSAKHNANLGSAINAVVNAYKNGTVMVGMALPYDGIGIGFPANLASDHVVFTVGAANLNNGPFQYSGIPESDGISFDTKDINLIAPGVDLLTTVTGNQKYDKVSGTAASAALTTGIISLLQAAESDLTPDDIAHILEKTAAPVGSPGYNDKSGYGLIDAGAAMNYVQSHDIKHGTTTDAEIQKVANNRKITLFSASAWEEVASSVYFADIYKVTYTIPLVPSPNNDLWFNAKGTYGWSYANPNSQNKWVNVELLNDHATITTYIYNLYNYIGQHVGWHPASPNTVQLHYSYVGQIQTPPPPSLEVTISGPNRVNSGQSATFSANVLRADGPVSYQWYYRRTGDSGPLWHIPLNNSSSSFSHTFYGPDEKISIAGVKIKVTSGGETATDILNFPVYGQGCSDGPAGDEGIGISGTIPAPCD